MADSKGTDLGEEELFGPDYLIRRPLLRALEHPGPRPAVLLIDELDRADDDFEAFLLELLAEATVTIPEIGTIKATHPPIVILTSNRTRDLHDAVKRRCLYQWIDYPGPKREVEIVRRRVKQASQVLTVQVANAVSRMRASDIQKPPGIAEAIDWVSALDLLGVETLDGRDGRPDARVGAEVRRGPGGHPRAGARGAHRARIGDRVTDNGNSVVEDDGVFRVEDLDLDLPAVVGAFSQRLHDAGDAGHARAQTQQYARSLGADEAGLAPSPVLDDAGDLRHGLHPVADVRPGLPRGLRKLREERLRATIRRHRARARAAEGRNEPRRTTPDDDEDLPESRRGRRRHDARRGRAARTTTRRADEVEIPILLGQRGGGAVARSTSRRSPSHELAALYRLMVRLDLATPLRAHAPAQARPPRRAHGHAPHAAQQPAAPAATRSSSRAAAGASRSAGSSCCATSRARWSPTPAPTCSSCTAPRASGPDHEAFVFATRLTRLTKQLAGRNPKRAIRRATEAVEDWSSGTRIGDALKTFNDRYGRRGMARGVGHRHPLRRLGARRSRDGRRARWSAWRGSPTASCGSTRASARRASQPNAGGLVAALPYCDALVSGHSLKALDEVADAIAAEHDDDALGRELAAAVARRRGGGAELGHRRVRLGRHRDAEQHARHRPEERPHGSRPQLVGHRRRRLRHGPMMVPLAHIAGIPLEETIAMAVPVLGATCAALMATLRGRGRRPWRRTDKSCPERRWSAAPAVPRHARRRPHGCESTYLARDRASTASSLRARDRCAARPPSAIVCRRRASIPMRSLSSTAMIV